MNELVTTHGKAPIFLCGEATDMRLGLPGLQKKVKLEAKRDPFKLGLYIFVSKDFRRIKLFYYERDGFAMWYKFVPKGAFRIEHTSGYRRITAINLRQLLKGSPRKVTR